MNKGETVTFDRNFQEIAIGHMLEILWSGILKGINKDQKEKRLELVKRIKDYFNEMKDGIMSETELYSKTKTQMDFDNTILGRLRKSKKGQRPLIVLLSKLIEALEKRLLPVEVTSAYLKPEKPIAYYLMPELIPEPENPVWEELIDPIYDREDDGAIDEEFVKELNRQVKEAKSFILVPLDKRIYFPNRSTRRDSLILQMVGIPIEEAKRRDEAIFRAAIESGIVSLKPYVVIERKKRLSKKRILIEDAVKGFNLCRKLKMKFVPEKEKPVTSIHEVAFLKCFTLEESKTFYGMQYQFFHLLRDRLGPLFKKGWEAGKLTLKETQFLAKYIGKLVYFRMLYVGLENHKVEGDFMDHLQIGRVNPVKEIRESISKIFSDLGIPEENSKSLKKALIDWNQPEVRCENPDCKKLFRPRNPNINLCSTCFKSVTIRKKVQRLLKKQAQEYLSITVKPTTASKKVVGQQRRTKNRSQIHRLNPPGPEL
jgi:hypothetical protein